MTKRRAADTPMLRQLKARGIHDVDAFEAWLAARGWAWQGLDRGDYNCTLEEALVLYVFEDPVRWAETYLIEPDTGEPWKFFDYQKVSAQAWNQDIIHQDGAEVGKTREIVVLTLWGQCTCMGFTVRRPWMLVGAPQQTFLDEIVLAIEEQVGAQADGSAKGSLLSQFWLKPKRTPHTMLRFKTIPLGDEQAGVGRVYFRPAGHDGEAFRGVHVNALLLMDEAAKLKAAVQWSEFWRAAKPGCCKRIYSVPDGDRSTEFFRLSQQAVLDLPPNRDGWRLFHWAKTLMPPPFWTPEREARLVRDFGGRHTPGFKRNVMGEWGEAENPIWSWDLILPNVQELPGYRVIKFNVDRARREMQVEVKSTALHVEQGKKAGVEQWLEDSTIGIDALMSRSDAERRHAMRDLLRTHLTAPGADGVYWAGADLGESNDPTEIVLSEQRGPKLQDVLRIHASGMDYYMQRELIYCLQELFGWRPHWGCDLGAAGTVVVKDLQTLEAYAAARFDETMTGFQFSNAVDCIGEDGQPLIDSMKDEAEEVVVRAPAKHWASQCITQRLVDIGYVWAYDTEALNAMTNQTCRQGAKWPIYSKVNDHIPDARRMQMLRKLYDEGDTVDVFSTGAFLRAAA